MSMITSNKTKPVEAIFFNPIFGTWPDRFATLVGIEAKELCGTMRDGSPEPVSRALIGIERYTFDFRLDRKWAQVDTSNDAHYYGHWTNPYDLIFLGYVEGDTTLQRWATMADYVTGVKKWIKWAKKANVWRGIDGMCRDDLIARFQYVGLGKYLH